MSTTVQNISERLSVVYSEKEASLISKYLIADLFSDGPIDIFLLDKAVERLINNEPLQYVTGKSYFLNYVFYVDQNVLIPRPETEELVNVVARIIKDEKYKNVIELGTGSGCIAISIKDICPQLNVTSIDVSEDALKVAATNATKYNTKINFIESDFLDEENWQTYGEVDIVVSNPPYISSSEQADMKKNVLLYEPHIALFAGEDTLIFYKKIAKFAALNKATCICEINELFSQEIIQIFEKEGFVNVEIVKDMQGKDRVVVAMKKRIK